MVFADRSLPRGRGPEGPCFQLANPSVRAAFRTPAVRAAQDDCTSARDSLRPNARGSASATSHLNRYTWAALTRLRSSLDAAARTVACPSPTRTFTFELSFHESPHQNVEHDYAGKSSISRGRTCTGWTRSLTGCTTFRTNSARVPGQIVGAVLAAAGLRATESCYAHANGRMLNASKTTAISQSEMTTNCSGFVPSVVRAKK